MANDKNKPIFDQKDIEAMTADASPQPLDVTPEQDQALEKEINLEKKYGDKNLKTFLESSLSGATFGLSDQALVKAAELIGGDDYKKEMQQGLRERRIRNKEADIAGEITGIIVPSLLTGGSSALAKSASLGVKTAAKAGLGAEKLTANIVNKLISETGKKEIAKQVLRKSIAKGAGSAVEGSLYGIGELLSEEALGNADFNAENLITYAGTGAALAGLAGSTFGAVEAIVPVIKNSKVVNFVNKKFNTVLDPETNAMQLAGLSPTQIAKKKASNPILVAHTPEMLKEVANKKGLNAFSSNEKLLKGVSEFIEETGEAIGKSLDDITKAAKVKNILPTKSKLAQTINKKLDDLASKFKDADGAVLKTAKSELNQIERVRKQFDIDLTSESLLSAKDLNTLKKKYQSLAKWNRRGSLPVKEEINRTISRAIREEVLEVAEKAGDDLALGLKKQLKDYGAAIEFADEFGTKIDKQSVSDFLNFKDLVLGGILADTNVAAGTAAIVGKKYLQSDLKRKFVVLSNIEKANQKVTNTINSSVKNFISKPLKALTKSTIRPITSSILSKNLDHDKPKSPSSDQEAFNNVQKNLNDMKDLDKFEAFLKNAEISDVAPQTNLASKAVLTSAITFLQEKMPVSKSKDSAINILMKKAYKPSSVEISKFERYLEAIENPLSVLKRLESGNISREGVEVLQNVYPNLYSRIQEQTMVEIQNNPESIDYKKRLQLGVLLNIPTDAGLHPENIKALQSHFKETEDSQSGGSISSSKASKLDMAESTATEVQKVSNRTDL